MPQLNAFDAAPGRSVVVAHGDLFHEAIDVDLLVISAWEGFYEPQKGSMVAVLEKHCGLQVGDLRQHPELDLTAAPTIRGWVTPLLSDLPNKPQWPNGSKTRFRRLAVVEGPREVPAETTEQTVFQQMFCLLALLPLHGIDCHSVATPLLNTGRQKAEAEELYPAMVEAVGNGFRHVPDLRELVIFDLKEEPLRKLCDKIDQKLERIPLQREVLSVKEEQRPLLDQLLERLRAFQIKHPEVVADAAVHGSFAEIVHQLEGEEVTLVTLGMSSRKLLEALVAKRLRGRGATLSLYQQVKLLSKDISAWSASAIHTVRTFGNWMGHAKAQEEPETMPMRDVNLRDLQAMLLALERVLEDYPWPIQVGSQTWSKRPRRISR